MMSNRDASARDYRARSDESTAGSISGVSEMSIVLDSPLATRSRSPVARIFGVSPLNTGGRDGYRLAMGAIGVGDALDVLVGEQAGWHVLHSVRLEDGAELDHLIVSAAGVFIVRTAVHPDGVVEATQRTFTVSDVRHPHIRNMEHEMGRAERLLSTATGIDVEISGVVAVVDPRSLLVREPHRDVAVLPASAIVRWLSGRTRVLLPDAVNIIAAAASRSSTWQVAAPAKTDPFELRERFDALRRDVDRAWNRQRLWTTASTVTAAGTLVVVIYGILVSATGTGHA